MRIGFYAPLKAPDHPVPSGDRQMARHLVTALALAGHEVDLYSRWRAYAGDPAQPSLAALQDASSGEVARVAALWTENPRRPDLLFTYHPYYKAPDLIGPALATRFGLPYVTAEASWSDRRAAGPWADRQVSVAEAVRRAALNICFTERDRDGLAAALPDARLLLVPPFIDTVPFGETVQRDTGARVRLVTVAMMRPGDKARSYGVLAEALASLPHLPWHLTVIGDGPARAAIGAALSILPGDRVSMAGAVPAEQVPAWLAEADLMVWPGFNEAFGLCYLEAAASGVPAVAVRNAGTPAVVRHGETGWLTDADPQAYAAGVTRLIRDTTLRVRLGAAARRFAHEERSLDKASRVLHDALGRLAPGGVE